jgi:hypothetical protein
MPPRRFRQIYRSCDECFDVNTDAIARSNLHVMARYAGIEITVRTIVDELTSKKFYRVWRTK